MLHGWIVFHIMNTKMRFQSESHPIHDCDEWRIIVDGIARVFSADGEILVGPGDMVFTPIEESYKIEAVTMVKVVWFEGPLQDQQRKGHLHL